MKKGGKLSEKVKKKISKTLRENPYWKGKQHTKKTKEKMRKAKLKNPTRYWLGKKRPLLQDTFAKWRMTNEVWNKGKKGLQIAWNKGMSADWLKGDKNPSWRGGTSFEPYSVDWTKTLKRSIRERDKYTCQTCGKEPAIFVHHIDYDKKNCKPNNLITLCSSCHAMTNFNRDFWKIVLALYNQA